jgi:hypothetical protein
MLRVPRKRRSLASALALLAVLALAAAAAAAPIAHRLPPGSAGFWTPARIQRALLFDSLEHRRLPVGGASASSLKVTEPTSPTNRTNGKILGFDPRFGPYSCSGTSLATPSGSIVLTAGHCVFEEGRFGNRLVFMPAFNHGERPFGTFLAEAAFITVPWKRTENPDFDVAAMQVAPNEFGTLTTAVGAKGWTSSRSRFVELQIFGYPAGALGGEEMRECITRASGFDRAFVRLFGPPPMAANCNMASGSSGGGWLTDAGTLLDGVTSYHHIGNHVRHYSPYFSTQVEAFLRQLP